MSGSDPDREYRFLDVDALDEENVPPINMTAPEALREALLDIIQLSEREGVTPDEVDDIIRAIQDERASRTRSRFTLHLGSGGAESSPQPNE